MSSDNKQTDYAVVARRNSDALIEPLRAIVASCQARGTSSAMTLATVGRIAYQGRDYDLPRVRIAGPYAGHDPIRLGLFAGIHGDEPAGCAALVQFSTALATAPSRAAGYELFVYPIINPVGYERDTRVNHNGVDLNRGFWRHSTEVEVQAIEAELRAHAFHGIITLHTDDTCEGVYGYAHGRTLNEALMGPALTAANRFLPVDKRGVIDGFPARAGLICDCFPGVLSAPPEQRPQPFDLIFETPAFAAFDLQVAATVAALDSILETYPGFIAYAQGL